MIDVLTLVKNRAAHLDNLVEGLRRSSVPPSRLVIVDMSDRPVATPSCGFPVTLIRHPTAALPLAEARNLAAAAAQADHLLFLDVDCIPSSGLVAAIADALSRHDALICAEVLYLPAGDASPSGWTEEMLLSRGRPHPVRVFPEQGLRREKNAGLFWSLAFGISRRTFHRLGGFDERFTGYGGEDTDFGKVLDPPGCRSPGSGAGWHTIKTTRTICRRSIISTASCATPSCSRRAGATGRWGIGSMRSG